jgi:hypothetical protein
MTAAARAAAVTRLIAAPGVSAPARIVIGSDFSPGADRALHRVASLPIANAAEVRIVHVLAADELGDHAAAIRGDARTRLAGQAAPLRAAFAKLGRVVPRVEATLCIGKPTIGILELADELGADRIHSMFALHVQWQIRSRLRARDRSARVAAAS